MISFNRAVRIAREKEGYEPCTRSDHGYGRACTYNGKTAPARFVICPLIQIGFPKPSFAFHSKMDFRRSSDKAYRAKGWIK